MPKRHRLHTEISNIISLTPTVKEIYLKVPADFIFQPGQYVTLSLKQQDKVIARSYSICSSPTETEVIKLCVKIVAGGEFTSLLNTLSVGQAIKVVGPMGNFVLAEEELTHPKVFIGTGTGLSPLMSMLLYNLEKKPEVPITLLTGYRHASEILYRPLWQSYLQKYKQFNYHIALTQPEQPVTDSTIQTGRIQTLFADKIDSHLLKNPYTSFYLCGLSEMIIQSREKLLTMGVKATNIHYEQYD